MNDEIEFRLRGEAVKPGLVRSHELAELLESVEAFVVAEALAADASIARDDIVVGLYEIGDRSIGLKFKTTLAASVIPAFISASNSIAAAEFDSLTAPALKSLEVVSNFTKRHNCSADLQLPEAANPLASITPETEIPAPTSIDGETEIVGRVLRVGGKVPRAMIELLDGSVIYCGIALDVAQSLGHQLYRLVQLQGSAAWDSRTLELQKFLISNFDEFPQNDPVATLTKLRAAVGSHLSDVDDVVAFVADLRSEAVS